MKLRASEWAAVAAMVLVVGALGGWAWWHCKTVPAQESGICVHHLSGETTRVRPEDYGKITPFGWVVTLDLSTGRDREDAEKAFAEECRRNPELEAKVMRFLLIKTHLEMAKRGRRVVVSR
jgi:hypothetical protein